MNKATKVLLAAALAVTMSGAAMASHICAYVNDDVSGPNAAEGYKIGPGTATVHVGPYPTNGIGSGGGPYAGGLGATRVEEGDLYIEDSASEDIAHFTIDKSNCSLTLDPILYPSGDTGGVLHGDPLAITPNGGTMFVASQGDQHIYSHTIAVDGSLGAAFVEGSTPDFPDGIEVSPDGTTLVVAYPDIQELCAYPISDGHLGTPNCQSTAGYPAGVSMDPAGACVYAGEASGGSEVAAFTLSGGILGAPTDYRGFGPGEESQGILVDWDNSAIYISNYYSAELTIGTIASGCHLNYKTITSDGSDGADYPGQIAQAKIAHGYVVTGDFSVIYGRRPRMGIFHAHVGGNLTPIGSGQFPLMSGLVAPFTVLVVGAESP